MIYKDYIAKLASHLLTKEASEVIDSALERLDFFYDNQQAGGFVSAASVNNPWTVYASPGWDGHGLEADGASTIVPVQITDIDGNMHPALCHIDGFRLRLTGFLEADTITYASCLWRVVLEVIKQPKVLASV